MHRDWKQVTSEAVMMFRRDRRREIDAVIDYFGETREARASRPGPILRVVRKIRGGDHRVSHLRLVE